MDAHELRERAAAEAAELRPIPADVREREMWAEERRGACVLLARLADWRPLVLRNAALERGELTDTTVVRLLLDAAQECL